MSESSEEYVTWWRALAEDPEYYTNTEDGQKELAEMIRKESERLLEEIGRSVKRTKDIIWLSRFCSACKYYKEEGRRMMCTKWGVRIVKPFQGRAIWSKVASPKGGGEMELVLEGIDWDSKWKEISDRVVEMSVNLVNGGYPYFCYSSK